MSQIGVLVDVLIAMGCIANECWYGTTMITLSKPVSRNAFVSAKLIAMSITFIISILVASAFCFGYTYWLIEPASLQSFTTLNLLLALFLVFCLTVTLFFSSVFRNSLAAGGVSIAVIITQAGLATIPRIGSYLPGKLLGWGNNLLSGNGDSYWRAFAITIVVIFLCVYFARQLLRNRDL